MFLILNQGNFARNTGTTIFQPKLLNKLKAETKCLNNYPSKKILQLYNKNEPNDFLIQYFLINIVKQ